MKGLLTTFLFLLLAGAPACQSKPLSPEEIQAARIERLGSRLRCPVCRGVPIAESPATLATEMMQVLREQVAAGKSDEEILKYFEDRYGEWVLLDPKPEGMNLLIWILPAFFLVGGAIFIIRRFKCSRERL